MQTLNTVQQIRDAFNIVQEISNQRLSFCLLAARRTVKNWCGTEAFEDALVVAPINAERAEALRSAEAHLAVYHLLLNTGARVYPFERTAERKAAQGGNSFYLPPGELQQLRKEHFDTAAELASPYRTNKDNLMQRVQPPPFAGFEKAE